VKPLCIVDTNVVVSGLVSRAEGAPHQWILNAMLAAELGFALSVELLAEYRGVLLRPGIMALHSLGEAEADEILQRLALEAVEVDIGWAPGTSTSDPVPIAGPDGVEPGDEHIARLALALPACVERAAHRCRGPRQRRSTMYPSARGASARKSPARGRAPLPMTQVRLSSKYQVVIPEDVRRELDLTPGQLFEVFAFGGALRVVPVRPFDEAFGMLARFSPRAARAARTAAASAAASAAAVSTRDALLL